MKKILITTVLTESFYKSRKELITLFHKEGYELVLLGPEKIILEHHLPDITFKFYKISMERNSTSILNDIRLMQDIKHIIEKEKPDVVYSFGGAKSVIYSSLAAAKVGVKKIYSTINGLGSMYRNNGFKNKIIRITMDQLYRTSLKYNEGVMFQNNDDAQVFVERRLVKKEKIKIVNGSGVNLDKYSVSKISLDNNQLRFLFVGRILEDKGIREFITAANYITQKYDQVYFDIVGPLDSNPNAISIDKLKALIGNKSRIKYYGRQEDVKMFYEKCSVFVLPSYHEGTPRTNLEAMAIGRPIITTDVPGCRETIIDRYNGLKIEARDTNSLINAIKYMINNKEILAKWGQNSRKLAEKKFDVNDVNREIYNFIANT